MLSIKYIVENIDIVEKAMINRGNLKAVSLLPKLLELYNKKKKLQIDLETLRFEKNKKTKEMALSKRKLKEEK